jgi:hypothetical protein
LGKFNWVIDAKGNMEQPNKWEEWWSTFIFPVLQTRSFTRSFSQLPAGIGDYSHLKRFETQADPFIRQMSAWKEGDPEPLDLGLVMRESFAFSGEIKPGLELVDRDTGASAISSLMQKADWCECKAPNGPSHARNLQRQ